MQPFNTGHFLLPAHSRDPLMRSLLPPSSPPASIAPLLLLFLWDLFLRHVQRLRLMLKIEITINLGISRTHMMSFLVDYIEREKEDCKLQRLEAA